ncbi:hypothetical protein AGMMS49928_29790 [Spirochaetia bacterium]|nr:hypothetical protein AGMMS49928_29790 [Spirochaetia bacterium]
MKSNLFHKVELMQNSLIACATGHDYSIKDYTDAREILVNNNSLKHYLPDFVFSCRTPDQFWPYIQKMFPSYSERRGFIWNSFNKLLSYLENENANPLDNIVSISIKENTVEYINEQWQKALERRDSDPEGAITTARTLVETTCKYILDSLDISYDESIDLPKLYSLAASQLNLSPQNHQEEIFKQILGSCQSVVNGLGSLRNKIGDAHGKSIRYIKPKERHAKLAVNLAGSLSSFLIDTFKENFQKQF